MSNPVASLRPNGSEPTFSENEPPSRSTAPGAANLRGIVDALMQGSLVELFQAYGVAIAPLPRHTRGGGEPCYDLSVVVPFTSAPDGRCPNVSGRLCLSIAPGVLGLMDTAQQLASPSLREPDWARELLNQLMGRFKNRLLTYGARLRVGVPSSISREALEAQLGAAGSPRVYRARTRRGEVMAVLESNLKEAELVYVGGTSELAEGKVLFF